MERSAGVVMYRVANGRVEVLLGHLGGPYWARKDDHAWTIPKGLVDTSDSDEWATARREFTEEMGQPVPDGPTHDLGVFRQHSRKEIRVWAVAGDLDAAACSSNMFELEWPPKSGRLEEFPEIDRARWFTLDEARTKAVKGQRIVLDALATHLAGEV